MSMSILHKSRTATVRDEMGMGEDRHPEIAGFREPTCRYGASSTIVRGPAVSLDAPYSVVLGGSEVYGPGVAEPFTACLSARTGKRIVNLGVLNAGPDVFVRDEALLAVAGRAEVAVIQTLGAHRVSNRFFTVHPRRNDRFLRQSDGLAALYPEIDFTDFTFTRHLLHALRLHCPDRFEEVAEELRLAWVARMRQLTDALAGRRILLDLRGGASEDPGPDPLLVTGDMIAMLRDSVDDVVTCDLSMPSPGGPGGKEAARRAGRAMPLSDAHETICAALLPLIDRAGGLAA